MKLLADFFPIVLFFVAYKFFNLYVATAVAIVVSAIQVGIYWLRYHKLDRMQLTTLILIAVLGGATLLLHNEIYIKWKPSILNWAFAFFFLASHFIGKKPLIQRLMEKNIILSSSIWIRLNLSWVSFFTLMGFLNLYVIYHFSTDAWVNFKLFGMLGLTLLFIMIQAVYLARHVDPHKQPKI
ncbi:MAG: septation protein [Gammaproteobacteria bacterium]|nr:septation protein [Gammaproteobacteria bacterium]